MILKQTRQHVWPDLHLFWKRFQNFLGSFLNLGQLEQFWVGCCKVRKDSGGFCCFGASERSKWIQKHLFDNVLWLFIIIERNSGRKKPYRLQNCSKRTLSWFWFRKRPVAELQKASRVLLPWSVSTIGSQPWNQFELSLIQSLWVPNNP